LWDNSTGVWGLNQSADVTSSWNFSSAVYLREFYVGAKEQVLKEYSLNQMEVECILWVMMGMIL